MHPTTKIFKIFVLLSIFWCGACNFSPQDDAGKVETAVALTMQARDVQATMDALQAQLTALAQPTQPIAAPVQPIEPPAQLTVPPAQPIEPPATPTTSGPARIKTIAATDCFDNWRDTATLSAAGPLPPGIEVEINQRIADNAAFFVVYMEGKIIKNICWVRANSPTIQVLGDLSKVPVFTPQQ